MVGQVEFAQAVQRIVDAEGGEQTAAQIWDAFVAEYLEVSRNAVGTWINGRNKPSPQTAPGSTTGAEIRWYLSKM